VKLFIMRHGPAEDFSPSGSDAERDLSPAGRERVRAVAKALQAAGEAPLAIISSPLVRALQTAEIVAAHLETEPRVVVSTRRELCPAGQALTLVSSLRQEKRRRVMLVGHEPDVSSLTSSLLGRPWPRGFMKGMVVGLSIADEAVGDNLWGTRFRFVLDPKTLQWQREL
jgi:phosphohistidine phosphatase